MKTRERATQQGSSKSCRRRRGTEPSNHSRGAGVDISCDWVKEQLPKTVFDLAGLQEEENRRGAGAGWKDEV